GADGALHERRHIVDRELYRRLVETPGQADEHHQHHAGGVERPRMTRGDWRHQACSCCRQWAQTPPISITGAFGVKPAERAAALSWSVTPAEAASPTAPQCSQIRNTTRSPVEWSLTQATKALRLSMRCTSPLSRRKSSAR